MSEQTQPLAAKIETVKAVYAAINRNDIPAALEAFDPQMEWIEPEPNARWRYSLTVAVPGAPLACSPLHQHRTNAIPTHIVVATYALLAPLAGPKFAAVP